MKGVPAGAILDAAGQPRFHDDPGTPDTGVGTPPIVDMGAFEFQGDSQCEADCDHNAILDLFDFLCFVNHFNAGHSYADCDGSGSLSIFDFLCYVNLFNAGCP